MRSLQPSKEVTPWQLLAEVVYVALPVGLCHAKPVGMPRLYKIILQHHRQRDYSCTVVYERAKTELFPWMARHRGPPFQTCCLPANRALLLRRQRPHCKPTAFVNPSDRRRKRLDDLEGSQGPVRRWYSNSFSCERTHRLPPKRRVGDACWGAANPRLFLVPGRRRNSRSGNMTQ